MQELSLEQLRSKTEEFRSRLAQGASLDDILPEVQHGLLSHERYQFAHSRVPRGILQCMIVLTRCLSQVRLWHVLGLTFEFLGAQTCDFQYSTHSGVE